MVEDSLHVMKGARDRFRFIQTDARFKCTCKAQEAGSMQPQF